MTSLELKVIGELIRNMDLNPNDSSKKSQELKVIGQLIRIMERNPNESSMTSLAFKVIAFDSSQIHSHLSG